MSLKQKRRLDCALAVVMVAIVGGLAWAHVQKPSVTPEELLPADSVLYVGWSGIDAQREAYAKSALHDVIEGTSVGKFFAHVSEAVFRVAGVEGAGPAREFWDDVWRYGAVGSLAFSTEPKTTPVLTLVFPGAAEKKRAENLNQMIRTLAENAEVKTVEQDGRTLHVIAGPSGEQFVWWAERGHVVLTLSESSELPLAVATGRKPNLRSNGAFKEFQSTAGSQPILQIWGDLQRATALMVQSNFVGCRYACQARFRRRQARKLFCQL